MDYGQVHYTRFLVKLISFINARTVHACDVCYVINIRIVPER